MTIDEKNFRDWYEFHAQATGAGPAVGEMFKANHRMFAEKLRADLDDLCDATNAVVFSGRIPKFANEHLEAVIREVRAAREERAVKARPDASEDDYTRPPTCACGGTGLVCVPHPKCVWNGRLVLDKPGGRVLTTAVLCDALGCVAGSRVRNEEYARQKKDGDRGERLTLANYHRQVGLRIAPAALAGYEREEAEKVRREHGPGPNAGVFASLIHKAKGAAEAA